MNFIHGNCNAVISYPEPLNADCGSLPSSVSEDTFSRIIIIVVLVLVSSLSPSFFSLGTKPTTRNNLMAYLGGSNCAGGPECPFDPSVRTVFTDTEARIYAWPSKGGVIILDTAEAIDFDFLGLDPLEPPLKRLEDQAEEDAFAQRLLLLGAKWWDSEARYSIVSEIETGGTTHRRVNGFHIDEQRQPTMREKRLLKAGWPSNGGGVWVAEFDTVWAGVDEEDNLVPYDEDIGRLRMARTMDERCAMLRDRFEARFYQDLKDYKGYGFFNSWDGKKDGEVGPLLMPGETQNAWIKAHYSLGQI
jgi:hypothetical protein